MRPCTMPLRCLLPGVKVPWDSIWICHPGWEGSYDPDVVEMFDSLRRELPFPNSVSHEWKNLFHPEVVASTPKQSYGFPPSQVDHHTEKNSMRAIEIGNPVFRHLFAI